jgi:NitT/TauT family transport system substrate-binding protein
MRNWHRSGEGVRALLLCIAAALALGAGACGDDDDEGGGGGGGSGNAAAERPATVKIGFLPIAQFAAMVVGQEQGLFEDENLDVELVDIKTPAETVSNVMNGQMQIGFANPGVLANAAQQNLPLRVVVPAYFTDGADQGMYVTADSPIQGWEDLGGTKLAMGSLDSPLQAGTLERISEGGVDPGSVEITLIQQPNIPGALENGAVDVAYLTEPQIIGLGDKVRELDPDPITVFGERVLPAVMFTSQEYAEQNADVLERFVSAWNASQEHAQDNPNAVRQAIQSFSEIPQELVDKMQLPLFGTELDRDSIQKQVDLMAKYELLSSSPDLSPFFP